MNYPRGTRICGGLFLISLILILYVNRVGRTDAAEIRELEAVQLIDEHVADIAAIAINHDNVRFGLIHQPPQILLEPALPEAELSQEELQSFLYRLSKLTAIGKIRRNGDLADYGLDPPRSLVTLIMRDGEKIRLALGNVNPVGDSSYLFKEGSEDIFLLSGGDSTLLTVLPDDFRDRSVLPRIEMSDFNLIRSISLDYESDELEDFTIINTSDFEFRLTEPFETTLDYESVLSQMIFPLISLSPDRVAELKELPESPGFRLSLQLGDERYDLVFRRGEESWFILREDLQRLYEIDAENVPWGDLRYRELLDERVYHVNISLLDRIEIREGQRLFTLELSGRSTELTGYLNEKALEYPEVMELYSTIFATGIAGIVYGPESAGLVENREPDLTVTVFKNSGAIDSLEFYSIGPEEYLVAINGDVNFRIYSGYLQALLAKVSSTAS